MFGSVDVMLLLLINVYCVFVNGGVVCKVVDLLVVVLMVVVGVVVFVWLDVGMCVFSEVVSFVVIDILFDNNVCVCMFGFDNLFVMCFFFVVKIGMSKDMCDNWIVGFMLCYMVGVWVGNVDGLLMWDVLGVMGVLFVWLVVVGYLYCDLLSCVLCVLVGVEMCCIVFECDIELVCNEWFIVGMVVDMIWFVVFVMLGKDGVCVLLMIGVLIDGMIFVIDLDILLKN